MMALTRDNNRTMPELDEFAEFATSMPREWRQGRAAALGDLAEETPRYAREPVEFPHWARLVLSQGYLNLIEPGNVQIAYVAAVIEPGHACRKNGVPESECDPLKLLLDGHAPSGALPGAVRIWRQPVQVDAIQGGKVLQGQVFLAARGWSAARAMTWGSRNRGTISNSRGEIGSWTKQTSTLPPRR